ncbi:MAG: DUF3540 domain-containing protein [Planctomycetes bacterium]|nr:DUF3540 domain-containing protein [Planctomycetota bacterium]
MNTLLAQTSYLGPATAIAVETGRALVMLPTAKAWATLALASGYTPAVGDVLLVIGKDETFYVIGVVAGRGQTKLVAHGDLEIQAPHGRIDLLARDGVTLRGGLVQIVAKTWETVAETVRQRFGELCCQVKGVLRTRAKRSETEVEDVHHTHAGRIVQHADKDVSIDGEKIHLG